MSARRAIWEVARREIVERTRSRVWRISAVVLLLVAAGGAIAAARLESSSTPTDRIGVVGTRSIALEPAIRAQVRSAGRRVRVHVLASATAASRAVRDGTVDVALIDGSRLVVKQSRSQTAAGEVQRAIVAQGVFARLRGAGLTETQALAVLAPRSLPVDVLEPGARNADRNKGLIIFGLIALLIALMSYGASVAQGVTEEKSSRVVELLLTTLPPRRLLAGKVFGIGLLGLVQLAIIGGAALAAGALAGGAGLPSAAPKAVALVVLWFVLGYVFYSVAFAAVGALVSRQEDLQAVSTPVTILLLGSFYLALFAAVNSPNGSLAEVTAYVPPLSPMVVPARMVLGNMTVVGLIAAVALDVLATVALIWLAARIYERSILQIGAPLRLGRVLARRSGPSTSVEVRAGRAGHAPSAELALRIGAVVLVLAGAVIGFGRPVSIALVAVGLLLAVVAQRIKRPPRTPVP